MIYSVDYHDKYAELYTEMRKYIWDLDIVEMLADVEVATFDAFIDYEKLQKAYRRLHPELIAVAKEEEDDALKKVADEFDRMIQDAVESEDPAVYELYRVQETNPDPEEIEGFSSSQEDEELEIHNIEDVRKELEENENEDQEELGEGIR